MGAGSSTDNSSKDINPVKNIDLISVPDILEEYLAPGPPVGSKTDVFRLADYERIDSHAKSAPASVNNDYGSLLDYLFEDVKTDLQMMRAIFSWLGSRQIENMRLGNIQDPNTPAGYMKLMQKQQGSYAAFFALLCRAAKIPCVVVRGKGKGVGYEAGDEEVPQDRCKWTAVFVAQQWRLVHPLWAFSGVEGQNNGRWTMIEKKGQGQRQRQTQARGSDVHTYEEFFFLTDPEQFIYFCRPNDESWQLLKKPWDDEQFVKSPCVTPEYFSSGLRLTSEHTCSLVAKKGKEAVRFEHSKNSNPSLSYELYCDEEKSDETLPDSEELERYVLENTQKNQKALFLRFPVKGIYKLRVFGGEGQNPPHICDFRIRCDQEGKNPNPFPLQKDIGYGYVQDAKEAGLVTTSAYSGIVVMEHGQKMTFEFNIDRPVEFETKLHHRNLTNEELDKYVEKQVTDSKAEITVTMPEEGLTKDSEYALEINTREKEAEDPFRNVCNYFLTPDKAQWKGDSDAQPNNRKPVRGLVKPTTRVQQKPVQAPVRSESPRYRMRDATREESVADLERTIREFEKAGLDEKDEDYTKAKERLVHLKNQENKKSAIRQRMRDNTKKQSIEELEKSIQDFEDEGLDEKDRDYTKAKERLQKLKNEEKKKEAVRERMRDCTEKDSIEDLERSIQDFNDAGLDEKDEDLTRAKEKLAKLKNDAYQEPEPKDESAREAMRNATDYGSPDDLEKAIKDFEDSGLDEKDRDLTRAKERLAELNSKKLSKEEDERLRKRLIAATDGNDIDELNDALKDAKEAGMEDKGDITRAEQKLMDIHRERLEEAKRARDEAKLQKALQEAEESAVARKLDETEDYQEAKETKEQIHRVRKYNKQVMNLNPRLVSEIASYKRPKPCIHDVMKATYIILGEEEEDLAWPNITKQMRSVGQHNVIRRVGQFDIVDVQPEQAKAADKLISQYDLNDVKRNSQGAGVFYKWTRNVIDEVNKEDDD